MAISPPVYYTVGTKRGPTDDSLVTFFHPRVVLSSIRLVIRGLSRDCKGPTALGFLVSPDLMAS